MRLKVDHSVAPELRGAFLEGFRQRTVSIAVTEVVAGCADPKDNKFLALAAAAEAELILASDIHLTSMHPWRDIPILPPAAFLVGIR